VTAVKIAPSVLTADLGRLADQAREAVAAGADYIHLDVMDGHFVPVITMGPLFVAAVRRAVDVPIDVHLMVDRPEEQVVAFREAGGDILSFHVESTRHPHRLLAEVRRLGARAGFCLNPGTPLAAVEELLGEADQAVVMAVNPGWGGQRFIDSALARVEALRRAATARGLSLDIEVDGGVNLTTGPRCVAAGASVLVAGAAVYNDKASVAENLRSLRAAIESQAGV
jgi:ribulose-phosphate 3-epimerase